MNYGLFFHYDTHHTVGVNGNWPSNNWPNIWRRIVVCGRI